jgi:hypothetical protein
VIVPVLGPHWHAVIGQAQNIDGSDGAEQGIGIGQGVGDRLAIAGVIATFPDNGLWVAVGAQVGRLVDFFQLTEQVAAVGFGTRDFHQVDHGVVLPSSVAACGRGPVLEKGGAIRVSAQCLRRTRT